MAFIKGYFHFEGGGHSYCRRAFFHASKIESISEGKVSIRCSNKGKPSKLTDVKTTYIKLSEKDLLKVYLPFDQVSELIFTASLMGDDTLLDLTDLTNPLKQGLDDNGEYLPLPTPDKVEISTSMAQPHALPKLNFKVNK